MILTPKIYSFTHNKVFDIAWINYENQTALSMEYDAEPPAVKLKERTTLSLNNCIVLQPLGIQDYNKKELYQDDIVRMEYEIDDELRECYHRIEFSFEHGFYINYNAEGHDDPLSYENVFHEPADEWERIMNYYEDESKAKELLATDNLLKKL